MGEWGQIMKTEKKTLHTITASFNEVRKFTLDAEPGANYRLIVFISSKIMPSILFNGRDCD
jgi:hypothetical protein